MHHLFKPLVFFLPVILWALALTSAGVRRWIRGSGLKRIFVAVCGTVIALPILLESSAIYTARMTLPCSDTILAISAAYLHGQPMYADLFGPTEYGLVYGPATYLIYLPVVLFGSDQQWVYQAWVMLALVMVPLLFWCAMRRSCGHMASLTAVAFLMSIVGQNVNEVWATKGDVWILFFSALGFWAAQRMSGWKAVLLVAAAGAVLVDLKATMLITAALPSLLLETKGHGRGKVQVCSIVLLIGLAGAVFLLPGISMGNFHVLLSTASRVGLRLGILKVNVIAALPMLIPYGLLSSMGWAYSREAMQARHLDRRYFMWGLWLSVVVIILGGSKVGGGPWHLLGFTVPLAFVTGELAEMVWSQAMCVTLLSKTTGVFCVGVVVMLASSAIHDTVLDTVKELRPAAGTSGVPPRRAEAEVLQIMHEHPDMTMQMGVSEEQYLDLTYVLPVIQLHGGPLMEDEIARDEMVLERLQVSDAMLGAVRTCRIGLWVVPKGGKPFSLPSPYYSMDGEGPKILYPDSFREAFFSSYRLMDSHYKYYDLWRCKQQM